MSFFTKLLKVYILKDNWIKCLLFLGMMLLTPSITSSQPNKVPPFQMIQANGKIFKAGDLPMGKPIIIIYFSPECDDCQELMQVLLTRIDEFKKASIAMITYLPVESVKIFVAKYNLNNYPNIYIGTEGDYFFVRDYYKIEKFPFMVFYSENGDLIKNYSYSQKNQLEDLSLRLRDSLK
jgi:thiol-disulfide isomerase/thioredoxin